MTKTFKTIGIIGKHRSYDIRDSLEQVIEYLSHRNVNIIIDNDSAKVLENKYPVQEASRSVVGVKCDLVIAVGGDGCFLNAARTVANHEVPIVGINRGHLGFLTDILPQDMEEQLDKIFNGEYHEEKRFFLHCDIMDQNKMLTENEALNEVVLLPGDNAQLIKFEIYIDDTLVNYQRADGLIISTPTGSTAYALSGGGPILHPGLDAIALVPMFPHNLSSRPIVVSGDSNIKIKIPTNNETSPRVSCDGNARVPVPPGGIIKISKYRNQLRLLHPKGYDFYETLRSKLGWEQARGQTGTKR